LQGACNGWRLHGMEKLLGDDSQAPGDASFASHGLAICLSGDSVVTLREELEILRGEPIEVFTGDPMDIPCIETSDSEKLCKHPVVSVYMTTYNHEFYIRQAIEGVMMQKTDFEFELVIGEDCSTDKTREICFEYQKKYPDKIRVLWSESNLHHIKGNGRRINVRMRGEYIAYCEGDDYWIDPLKLQKQVDVMRRHPNVGFCYCGSKILDQSTGVIQSDDIEHSIQPGLKAGTEYVHVNIFGRPGSGCLTKESYVRTASAMIRCCTLKRACLDEEILNWKLRLGDVPLWLSLAMKSDVYYLPDEVSVYRMTKTGACGTAKDTLWVDNWLVRGYFFRRYYWRPCSGVSIPWLQRTFSETLARAYLQTNTKCSKFLYLSRLRRSDFCRQFWTTRNRMAFLFFPLLPFVTKLHRYKDKAIALAWHGVVLGVKSILPSRVYWWVHRRLKGEGE
jgi:glycosyltransferase involved in cell wall biosynthesis